MRKLILLILAVFSLLTLATCLTLVIIGTVNIRAGCPQYTSCQYFLFSTPNQNTNKIVLYLNNKPTGCFNWCSGDQDCPANGTICDPTDILTYVPCDFSCFNHFYFNMREWSMTAFVVLGFVILGGIIIIATQSLRSEYTPLLRAYP